MLPKKQEKSCSTRQTVCHLDKVSTNLTDWSDLLYSIKVRNKPLMATRSRIGIELTDGSILSAYHHWDGYPQWLGRILNTHYNSREQAAELIDGGDMSCAWTKDRWTGKKVAEYVTENVEVEQYGPQYYSQRGEDCPPRLDNTLQQYLSDGEEYAYIFRDGEWVCYDMNEFNDNEPELTEIPSGALAV